MEKQYYLDMFNGKNGSIEAYYTNVFLDENNNLKIEDKGNSTDVVNWDEPFTIICESFNDRLITFSHIIREEYQINDKETVLWEIHDIVDYEENPNIYWDGEDFFTYYTTENPIPSWKFRGDKDKTLKFKFLG